MISALIDLNKMAQLINISEIVRCYRLLFILYFITTSLGYNNSDGNLRLKHKNNHLPTGSVVESTQTPHDIKALDPLEDLKCDVGISYLKFRVLLVLFKLFIPL